MTFALNPPQRELFEENTSKATRFTSLCSSNGVSVSGVETRKASHLFLEVVQEVEDFCLNGDVEGGGGFVGDEQGGVVEQRHGDHDALELAA